MTISATGSSYLYGTQYGSKSAQTSGGPPTAKSSAADEFMNYMKMTPAERMQANWLSSHGISKEKFEAMSPEEKQKLLAKMKHEIEEQIKKASDTNTRKVDITA
jgi:hypothetical protein